MHALPGFDCDLHDKIKFVRSLIKLDVSLNRLCDVIIGAINVACVKIANLHGDQLKEIPGLTIFVSSIFIATLLNGTLDTCFLLADFIFVGKMEFADRREASKCLVLEWLQ